MPVKNCALYAVGTVDDALCVEVLEVVLKVLKVVLGFVQALRRHASKRPVRENFHDLPSESSRPRRASSLLVSK
jgi:hypothetical protein